MDAVGFAHLLRQLALRAHGTPSDGATREELIELRGRFVDVLAAAPDGGLDVRRWIGSAIEKLDVQAASSRPAKTLKRCWTVGGTRRVRRSRVRRLEA
jgi:hypothetical protein